jgi:signal transduction histidine kinase
MKECPLRTKQATFIPVSWVFSPMKDSSNQTAGVVAVGRDLTERQKFETELHQSQKFAALGVMAGGIAHEIRNPLAICSSSAQFLMEEDGTPEFRRECAEKIHKGIQRTSAIIENLLKYSHPSTTTRTTLVNLVSLIRETLTLVTYHAKINKIEVESRFHKETIMVQGVATLLQQVFMNLFLNAINAMPTGGRLGIDVKMDHSEVRVQVTDTGCGISPKEIGKIFDPFYTTSTVGQGTGLGLSLCYSIVKQHRGIIEAESVEGRGSVFTVTLPTRFGGGEP